MKVNIISYEPVGDWILGKFALRMNGCLNALGVESNISSAPDYTADINHHIFYLMWSGAKTTHDTTMITHVDSQQRLDAVKAQSKVAHGICMSRDTLQFLVNRGVDGSRLSYVNPAQDGVIKPRKLNIGITTRLYADGRKREGIVLDLCKQIDPGTFKFTIIGAGWEAIVGKMKGLGFEVDYYGFEYKSYTSLVPTFDYYFYPAFEEEGSMGTLDALAAGVKTIVPCAGFHADLNGGITYSYFDLPQLIEVFREIKAERDDRVKVVADWTWEGYTKKHIAIWESILGI